MCSILIFLCLSSHSLLGFCALTPLKLFMPMTHTELKPTVGFQASMYLTSQQHLVQLTTASSLVQFLHLVSRLLETITHRLFFLLTSLGSRPLFSHRLDVSPTSHSLSVHILLVVSPSPINLYIICTAVTPKYISSAKTSLINSRLEPYKNFCLNV